MKRRAICTVAADRRGGGDEDPEARVAHGKVHAHVVLKVVLPDAAIEVRTMVVHAQDTRAAHTAVVRAQRPGRRRRAALAAE